MKKLSILALASAALLTAACSTNDAISEVQAPTLDGKGQGFLSVNVNLPVRSNGGTRVDASGQGDWQESTRLEDGESREYKVDDVLLVIFGGADEASATVQQIWSPTEVGDFGSVSDSPNQVTSRKKYVVKLDEGISGPYWVLAVVNAHNHIMRGTADNTIRVNGQDIRFSECKLSTLQAAKVTADTEGKTPFMNNGTAQDGFFMTNAVFSDQKGGETSASVKALVLAPVSTIYESETAAEAATATPSADIYVERGLAKVTVSSNLKFDGSVKGAGGATLKAPVLAGWVLDNTNMSSFIVRNAPEEANRAAEWGFYSRAATAGIEKFRFVGYSNVDVPSAGNSATAPTAYTQSTYRTYWSPDPNYGAYNKANFYEPKTKDYPSSLTAPQYCFENTFNVENQTYQNTTRVVAKITLNDGETFYTLDTDRKTLYQEDDVRKALAARIMNDERFKTWANGAGLTVTEANFPAITITEEDDVAGTVHISDISFTQTPSDASSVRSFKALSLTTATAIFTDAVNAIRRVQRYPSGVTYYAIRIKHFGDDLTPWGWNGEAESTIATIYPEGAPHIGTKEENYLGRYGVLRNNWYDLSLDNILKIGHPIVPWLNPDNNPNPDPDDPNPDNPNPEDPEHPDDSLDDSYISARINILSWAKRPQGIILK